MIGYSDEHPDVFVRSRGKIQFRFNIQEIPNPNVADGGQATTYQFEYLYADEAKKESVLSALNDAKVSDAEAKLNEMLGTDKEVKVTEFDGVTLKPIRPKALMEDVS